MVAAKDTFEGSSSYAESARRVMKLLFRREAWRVRVLVVADGKDVPAGMWTQTEESVGQRADFWLPEGANQSRRITLEEDLSVPECQLLSSLYCK